MPLPLAASRAAYTRDQLLIAYEGNEERLAEHGFEVVVGTAKSPARKNGNGQA